MKVTAWPADRAIVISVNSLPPLECTDILSREREPFALFALACKARVPVILDTDGIICLDVMDGL